MFSRAAVPAATSSVARTGPRLLIVARLSGTAFSAIERIEPSELMKIMSKDAAAAHDAELSESDAATCHGARAVRQGPVVLTAGPRRPVPHSGVRRTHPDPCPGPPHASKPRSAPRQPRQYEWPIRSRSGAR